MGSGYVGRGTVTGGGGAAFCLELTRLTADFGQSCLLSCSFLCTKVTVRSVGAGLRWGSSCCSLRGITNCLVRRGEGGRKDLGVTVVYRGKSTLFI